MGQDFINAEEMSKTEALLAELVTNDPSHDEVRRKSHRAP
jgi:hypothetical protein